MCQIFKNKENFLRGRFSFNKMCLYNCHYSWLPNKRTLEFILSFFLNPGLCARSYYKLFDWYFLQNSIVKLPINILKNSQMRLGINSMYAYFTMHSLIFFENIMPRALIPECLLIRESRVSRIQAIVCKKLSRILKLAIKESASKVFTDTLSSQIIFQNKISM